MQEQKEILEGKNYCEYKVTWRAIFSLVKDRGLKIVAINSSWYGVMAVKHELQIHIRVEEICPPKIISLDNADSVFILI